MKKDVKIRQLLERYENKCFYCKRDFNPDASETDDDKRTIDHYIPKAAGGSDNIDNLRLACRRCNENKRGMVPDDAPIADLPKVDVETTRAKRYTYTRNEYQIPLEERIKLAKALKARLAKGNPTTFK